MGECRPEKGTINAVETATGWRVNVETIGAKQLDSIKTGQI